MYTLRVRVPGASGSVSGSVSAGWAREKVVLRRTRRRRARSIAWRDGSSLVRRC